MPFVVGDNPSEVVCTIDAVQENPVYGLFRRAFEEHRVHISEISVGTVNYPLRRQLSGTYMRAFRELVVDGVSPVITGIGDTVLKAKNDFCLRVHAAFQELLHRRPFEMSGEDQLAWGTLKNMIDVTIYRNTTPIVVRQFGKIRKARPYPTEVQWEDGRREKIGLGDVADRDYVTYRPGQPFEAIVHRDPLTFELLSVVYIRRCCETKRLPTDEEKLLLSDIGSTMQLEQDSQWRP